ncbi:unnamed protein product, partial [Brachionus calyciflorus]
MKSDMVKCETNSCIRTTPKPKLSKSDPSLFTSVKCMDDFCTKKSTEDTDYQVDNINIKDYINDQ